MQDDALVRFVLEENALLVLHAAKSIADLDATMHRCHERESLAVDLESYAEVKRKSVLGDRNTDAVRPMRTQSVDGNIGHPAGEDDTSESAEYRTRK